ncbi:hypothetical protein [Singulisphaera sp. PoT]|uniref:hypothetical protein n=1 Tax=Singulisphaera sp. PoT TaxID=3411797 RepID=UPI003BF59178
MTHNTRGLEPAQDPGQRNFDRWVESKDIDLENATGLLALAAPNADDSYPEMSPGPQRCQVVEVHDDGPIAPGTKARLEPIPGLFVEATNRGPLIPPPGTPLLLLREGESWVFSWGTTSNL